MQNPAVRLLLFAGLLGALMAGAIALGRAIDPEPDRGSTPSGERQSGGHPSAHGSDDR